MSDSVVSELAELCRERLACFRREFGEIGDEATEGALWGNAFDGRWSRLGRCYVELTDLRSRLHVKMGLRPAVN